MRHIFTLLFTITMAAAAIAQEGGSLGTYTPYSLYGLGDFVAVGGAAAMGMGGVQNTRSHQTINMTNPAGASARDSLTFVIDFGGDMRNIYARTSITRTSFNSANFHHLAAAFPVWGTRCGINFGFMPYTRVGYDIEKRDLRPDIILSAGDVRYQYKGEDGLSQLFLNAGFNILPQWAVGAGFRYYFGKINRYYNTIFRSSGYYFDTESRQSLQVSGFAYTLGTQYTHRLGGERKLILGLSAAPTINIGATESILSLNHPYSTSAETYIDSGFSRYGSANFSMPASINAGISYIHSERWMLGAEFAWADWSKTAISGRSEMGNSFDVRLGGSFTPNRYDVRYYTRRMTYRAGMRYSQTPMLYDGKSVMDKAVTLGLGMPIRGIGEVNFAAEYGRRGSTANGGVREDYIGIALSLTLMELWFVKYKYE